MIGVMFEPSMLTFDGSIFYVVIHALLWFGSVIVAGAQQGDITEPGGVKWPDDAPQRLVYMYYMLFTGLAPGLLVVYEALSFMFGGYGMFRVPIQGFLFAFGFLGLAFGTASVPYAVAADVVPVFTFGLFPLSYEQIVLEVRHGVSIQGRRGYDIASPSLSLLCCY